MNEPVVESSPENQAFAQHIAQRLRLLAGSDAQLPHTEVQELKKNEHPDDGWEFRLQSAGRTCYVNVYPEWDEQAPSSGGISGEQAAE